MLLSFRFWLGPFLILICSYALADYQRKSVDFIVQAVLVFFAHGFFFVLTRPTKGNNSFPYHAKTNQISLINVTPKNTKETENYSHHFENEGGNIEFESILSTTLFSNLVKINNRNETYQISNLTNLVYKIIF